MPGYLHRLCQTRGMYDWQLFFADPAHLARSQTLDGIAGAIPHLRFIAVALPVLFPGTDTADYHAICKALTQRC